jgi:protein-S-isoprenylcysteine O-methyltransferase Ste14
MIRLAGIVFGLATQLLFLATVVRLYLFLAGGHAQAPPGSLWLDAALAVQFAVPHSLLLWPPVRQRLRRWIPAEFYGCVFCLMTCVSLLSVIHFWRSSSILIWSTSGSTAAAIRGAFLLSWGALIYSMWLSGLGRQTGWTTWYAWLRRRSLPAPEFKPRSWYRFVRHPIYLSFLGLIWFTPRLTLDMAILTGVWTAYLFVGSRLKDARLEHYIGDAYRAYERRVPGFPLIFFGPLGRHSAEGRS